MKTPVTVRIEADLLSQARRCASEDNRTLTNFIETVLRQKIAERSSNPSAPTATKLTVGHTRNGQTHVA